MCILGTAVERDLGSQRHHFDHLFSLQGKGQTFQFPNLFPEKEQDEEAQSFDEFRKKYLEKEQQIQKGDPRRGGVPDWFGL